MNLNYLEIEEIVRRALMEDIGTGDITTALTISPGSISKARILAKEDGIVAGLQVAAIAFQLTMDCYFMGQSITPGHESSKHTPAKSPFSHSSETIRISMKHAEGQPEVEPLGPSVGHPLSKKSKLVFTPKVEDGSPIRRGDSVAEVHGPTAVLLTAERTALNLLQRMSGIATKTSRLVDKVSHTNARIIDTRKTAPGLRSLDKYSVRCGGGWNHRYGLYDAVLIKDNHVQASGGIGEAVKRAKAGAPHTIKIEVETDTLEQVKEALDAGADMILLDNMSVADMKQAVILCRGKALTEASGNVTEETVTKIAETGVDLISVGALTHSVKALDLSLDFLD